MRICEYCRHENSEEATQCQGCGTRFLVSTAALRRLEASQRTTFREILHQIDFARSSATRPRTLALFWVVGVVLFAVYGAYFAGGSPPDWLAADAVREDRLKGGVVWGALGVSVTSCAVLGALVMRAFHSGRLRPVLAVLLLGISSVVSVALDPMSVSLGATLARARFHGVDGWGVAVLMALAFWFTILVFLVFTALLFFTCKIKHENN